MNTLGDQDGRDRNRTYAQELAGGDAAAAGLVAVRKAPSAQAKIEIVSGVEPERGLVFSRPTSFVHRCRDTGDAAQNTADLNRLISYYKRAGQSVRIELPRGWRSSDVVQA